MQLCTVLDCNQLPLEYISKNIFQCQFTIAEEKSVFFYYSQLQLRIPLLTASIYLQLPFAHSSSVHYKAATLCEMPSVCFVLECALNVCDMLL